MSSMLEENQNVKPEVTQKKNRRSLLLVLAAFVLPIILAKFALNGQWLATGVTNQGALLDNEITLTQLGIDKPAFKKQWLMLYKLPETCDQHCEKTMEVVHNTYVALGKEMPRITPVAFYQNPFSAKQSQQLAKSQWQLTTTAMPSEVIIPDAKVYIVDPLGNVFLSHPVPEDSSQLALFGKQIMTDMKKLLKYSKVG